ncbi:MAG TPA: dehypoxanthine futalosine cyclase [Bacteroidales bacterium]|nr:MAG: dehypoxanthine futalosine cyclase [Bacteroidetes bacterium GWF2_33_38]OFY76288.1 MAG: dehypoxanthine futalosine cyclase [Bacteroidetes bacterium RIFOXYA12_FULL_33_9]OFY89710.1 MAG: dehypoxanthine futalosine cyclase [Bacteroidetes bacterium RIFOXYA2_FULL_33_7]HBF88066.1 dehypoxanthine futalosine cyclase [Bacteroidales bacterium]
MEINSILSKAQKLTFLTREEAMFLYKNAALSDLIYLANEIRYLHHPQKQVTWIIDRNVNITNACVVQCKFCNFHCKPNSNEVYITSIEEYRSKIDELIKIGGDQLLLQGGLHPKLGLSYYEDLFSSLKVIYPKLKLHALGPPEIHFLARKAKISISETLARLTKSGLDSLPGAGAEILSDRVRSFLSKAKCSADEWINVMREAHKINLPTSATMMFGHYETEEERIEHLLKIRDLQAEKPPDSFGFLSFIPWPFQDKNTVLKQELGITNTISASEYVRFIAISRILLPNIKNIQASWLTVGVNVGQICLHAGANDFGSIMIEENVVSSAGADYSLDKTGIQKAIIEAGFVPTRRNQKFEIIE